KLLPLSHAKQDNDKIYKKLAHKVGYLPLALRFLAVLINRLGDNSAAINRFLNQYEDFYKKHLLTFNNDEQETGITTISALWDITLSQLLSEKKGLAVRALCYLSYLEGKEISIPLLARLLGIGLPPSGIFDQDFYTLEMARYIDPLYEYSLIEQIENVIDKEQENDLFEID
ncbi:MAG: hypothetical protein ACK4PR_14425, partial [Gammaproteobacteria bacterium]